MLEKSVRAFPFDGKGRNTILDHKRSGDVVFVLKPYSIAMGGKAGTTHGAPFSYDTHVPVLFYGSAFKHGRYADEFYITDIVPTLCAALQMNEPPGCIGKPCVKVLEEEGK